MQSILVEQWKVRYHCSVWLKYLRWYIFPEFLLWELTSYAGVWSDLDWKKPKNLPLSCNFCFPKHPYAEQYVMTADPYNDGRLYFNIYPFTVPISSSFYVWYNHFPSLGLMKQLISLSMTFVYNKTQSTETKKKLENKSKELLIFLSHVHVAQTIKTKNPKEESPCFSSCQSTKHRDSPNISHAPLSPPERLLLSQGDIIKHYSETKSAKFCYIAAANISVVQLNIFWSDSPSLLKPTNWMNLTLKFSQPGEKIDKKY